MNEVELYAHLTKACTRGYSAMRAVTRLEPIGSSGDAVFPPTYSKDLPNGKNEAVYAWFERGANERAVILDSVQSQANRFELALLTAMRRGDLALPLVETDIEGHGKITALDAPHRVSDAIFRDCLLGEVEFGTSKVGKALREAREWNAEAFFEHSPNVLIFGTWDSQSGGGTKTAKVARALVSEIVGFGAMPTARTESRIDPLGIKSSAKVHFIKKTKQWANAKFSGSQEVKPSDINHGNVTPTVNTTTGGVTFREALQTTVLSFTQLRKLSFGKPGEGDIAARAVLAALALYAVELFWEDGFLLRSRCQLLPETRPAWELIGSTAKDRQALEFDAATVRKALDVTVAAARKHGFAWKTEPVVLTPSAKLTELIRSSDASVGEGVGEEA